MDDGTNTTLFLHFRAFLRIMPPSDQEKCSPSFFLHFRVFRMEACTMFRAKSASRPLRAPTTQYRRPRSSPAAPASTNSGSLWREADVLRLEHLEQDSLSGRTSGAAFLRAAATCGSLPNTSVPITTARGRQCSSAVSLLDFNVGEEVSFFWESVPSVSVCRLPLQIRGRRFVFNLSFLKR